MATFEELTTLISLVSTHGQQPLPLLGKWEQRPGKETTLFENIREGRYQSDEQAASDLYGGSQPDKRYTMLKARLWQKLLNHLFFLDLSDLRFVAYTSQEQESLTLLHQAKVLIMSGNYEMAEDLLKRSFKIAQELGFTTICIECLEWRRYYYILYGLEKAYEKNQQQLTHFRAIAAYEREAEDLYQSIRLVMNKPVHIRRKDLARLPVVLLKMKAWWEQHYSPQVFLFYYRLNLFYHEQMGDFSEIIQLTTESQQLVKQGLVHSLRFDERFNKYMQVYAYLRTKEYEIGLPLAKEYASIFLPTTLNWFAHMENYLLLAVHTQQYELAAQLLKQVDENKFFWKLTIFAKEKWALYRAYVAWVSPAEQLRENADYHSLLQSIPRMTKDKLGFNVATLVLQFLHDLRLGDLDLLHCRLESIKQYTKRYLSDRNARRSRLFFRLLALVVKYQLEAEICRNKGTKLLAQLQATPSPGDAFAEIEIIPYEQLWEWVLCTINEQAN